MSTTREDMNVWFDVVMQGDFGPLAAHARKQRRRLVRRYRAGMVIQHGDYERLYAAQDGRCALCRVASETTLTVDHDHATGRVRGLLCSPCNLLLGRAEKGDWITRALAYINA